MFDIPVVLFIFKREKAVEIIKQISKIKPTKLYLIGDGPRNEEEVSLVEKCRNMVEEAVTWQCEIIKNYADLNRGVYSNIALGAKWVLEREQNAIFLEDDNFPEITFFEFCKEMLNMYKNKNEILWICGSNYLEKYNNSNNQSYYFTQHMLPCGWATWSDKFLKFYDFGLKNFTKKNMRLLKKRYIHCGIYYDYARLIESEFNKINRGERPISWDYHMDFTIKYYNLYGICPSFNQIKNIGVDDFSIHGGSSLSNVMTERFCENTTYPLSFPLIHPDKISIDKKFEKKLGKKILIPFKERIKMYLMLVVKKILKIPVDKSIRNRN